MRARVTRDDTIRAKNSTFGYFDATNPIPQLRCPTPIMAPGINEYSRSFGTSSSCKIVEALAKIKLLNHVLSLRQVVRDSVYIYKYCLGIQKDNMYSSMSSQRKSIKGIFLRKGNQSNVGTQCLTSGSLNLRYGL